MRNSFTYMHPLLLRTVSTLVPQNERGSHAAKPSFHPPPPGRRRTMLGGSPDSLVHQLRSPATNRCTALQSRASLMVCAYSCGRHDDTTRLNSAARGSGSHDTPLVCALLGQRECR